MVKKKKKLPKINLMAADTARQANFKQPTSKVTLTPSYWCHDTSKPPTNILDSVIHSVNESWSKSSKKHNSNNKTIKRINSSTVSRVENFSSEDGGVFQRGYAPDIGAEGHPGDSVFFVGLFSMGSKSLVDLRFRLQSADCGIRNCV